MWAAEDAASALTGKVALKLKVKRTTAAAAEDDDNCMAGTCDYVIVPSYWSVYGATGPAPPPTPAPVTCDATSLAYSSEGTLVSGSEGTAEAVGSQLVYTCGDGFAGTQTYTCDETGSFATNGVCAEPVTCDGTNLVHTNADTRGSGIEGAAESVGSLNVYLCNAGFTSTTVMNTIHLMIFTCTDSGTFTTDDVCSSTISATSATSTSTSTSSSTSTSTSTSTSRFACKLNEHVVGGACVECAAGTANAAGDDPSQGSTDCVDVTCDGTNILRVDAAKLVSGTEGAAQAVGSTIVYECNSGFVGSLTYTCSDSGTFTTANVCIVNTVTCDGRDLVRSNADTLTSGTEGAAEPVGSTIVYACNAGFSGSLVFTCEWYAGTFTTDDACTPACSTVVGTECVFPYVSSDVEYTACSGAEHGGIAWCSTSGDSAYEGGFCNSDCPVDASATTTADQVARNSALCPGGWHFGLPQYVSGVHHHYAVDGASMNVDSCSEMAAYYIGTLGLAVSAWGPYEGIMALHDTSTSDYCTLYFGDFNASDAEGLGSSGDLFCMATGTGSAAEGTFAETIAANNDVPFAAICPGGWKLRRNNNLFASGSKTDAQLSPTDCAAAGVSAGKGWAVMLSQLLVPAPSEEWDDRTDACYLFDGDGSDIPDERDSLTVQHLQGGGAVFYCMPPPPLPPCRCKLPTDGPYYQVLEPVDTAMCEYMTTNNISAGMLAIMKDGQILLERGYGYSDRALTAPMQADQMSRIASVSKSITAAAIHKLVAEGRFSLNDKVFDLNQQGGGGLLPVAPFSGADPAPSCVQPETNITAGWQNCPIPSVIPSTFGTPMTSELHCLAACRWQTGCTAWEFYPEETKCWMSCASSDTQYSTGVKPGCSAGVMSECGAETRYVATASTGGGLVLITPLLFGGKPLATEPLVCDTHHAFFLFQFLLLMIVKSPCATRDQGTQMMALWAMRGTARLQLPTASTTKQGGTMPL